VSAARCCGRAALLALAALLPACSGPAADAAPERILVYLHGRIIQESQRERPRHPEFGVYEYPAILEAFRARGFDVWAGIRPVSAGFDQEAGRVAAQVRALIASGVPAERITVVGASMGGGIALLASARLDESEVRFAVLGVCLAESVPRIALSEGRGPVGRVLAIREASDELTADCPAWSAEVAGLVARELVLDTGLRHGFLYRPLPVWVEPVARWADAGMP
jgi:pimeloyl-ACP methyl ester carboxylesterase